MAKLVLSAVLSVLFEKLKSDELLEFATLQCVPSKLKKLEKTLKMIEALLIDAEEKQLTNGAVKMWLEELQDLAYDAEDILDEYATEALRRKLKIEEHQASTSMALKLIPACCIGCTPCALWFDFSMLLKISGITSRLLDLCKQRTELGLVEVAGRRLTGLQRDPTTSSQTEPVVYGREEDKAKMLKMVLSDEPSDANYGVISVVGMGGLGKTTLAQHLYDDVAVKDFDPKGWVCISDDFDVTKISKAILESITKSATNLANLDTVQNQLKEKLAGKKFLLVLDDVWNEDYSKWHMLRSPFMVGARGSKIIVTTRHERVVSTMAPSHGCLRLLGLSDDDCWSLFKQHAIDNKDPSLHLVESIRPKVIEKCKGLPLAARTIGGLLRAEKRDEWSRIMDNKIWELLADGEIPKALQISYYHLPSELKRCFAYCGILPKDHEFEEKKLVLLWMAEGLIQQSNDNEQLEEKGSEYFRNLVSRSIFQISTHNSSKFIMHDLINDLAQMVSRKVSFRLEGELANQLRIPEKTRYASYLCHTYNLKRRFEVFNDIVCLRTHLSMPQINDWDWAGTRYISNTVISNLFSRFKKLRVLSLQKYHIIELPDSIGSLKLLRYLNLSHTKIKCLPESVKSMCNLQTLILRECWEFLKWPSSMRNLINLRHVDISYATSIDRMPIGMEKWKHLRTLSNFIGSKDFGSSLKDLKHLKFLCGELHISNLKNVIVPKNTMASILDDKKDLKVLLLNWGPSFLSKEEKRWGSRFNELNDEEVESQYEEMEKRLLDILQPHQNLEKLTIIGYGGKTFSSWVGNSSFSKMTILKLANCRKCISLPSLGVLGALKSLTIKGMKGLKSIDSTFYGQHCLNPFKSLNVLCFENLNECESWDPIKENESFLRLQELAIVNCPKLSGRLPNKLSSLKKLVICGCEQLVVSISNISKLCKLELNKCNKIVCTSSAFLESLEHMTLSNILDFGDLSRQKFKKLQNLKIERCEGLIELWQNEIFLEKPYQGLHSLSSLKELYLSNCNNLTTLLEGFKRKNVCVERLTIQSCQPLNFVFRGQLPQSLKKLDILECEKLECLLVDKEDTSTSSCSIAFSLPSKQVNASTYHLENLFISKCSSLTCLTSIDQFFTTLTSFRIDDCPKLTILSMTGHLPVALKHLRIERCLELTTLLTKGQFPETLESLSISNCPKLESMVERFHNNKALYEIRISLCKNLKSLPEGLETLGNLKSLYIHEVPLASLEFPDSILRVRLHSCSMLEALSSGIHTLFALEIFDCPNLSLSGEDLCTKLTQLSIFDVKQYKMFMERGLYNFTSLIYLKIAGIYGGESFPDTDMEITLPPNLTELWIQYFPKLQCLCFKDFEDLSSISCCPKLTSIPSILPSSLLRLQINDCPKLTSLPRILPSSLEELHIKDCPKLTSLPINLPSSLLELHIDNCPSLEKACKRDKGKEWPKIVDIPLVQIDHKFIFDSEEEALEEASED